MAIPNKGDMDIAAISLWFKLDKKIIAGEEPVTLLHVNFANNESDSLPRQGGVGAFLAGMGVEPAEEARPLITPDRETSDDLHNFIGIKLGGYRTKSFTLPNEVYANKKVIEEDLISVYGKNSNGQAKISYPTSPYQTGLGLDTEWHHLVINHNGRNYDIWLDGVNLIEKSNQDNVDQGNIPPWVPGAVYSPGFIVIHNKKTWICFNDTSITDPDGVFPPGQEPPNAYGPLTTLNWMESSPLQDIFTSSKLMALAGNIGYSPAEKYWAMHCFSKTESGKGLDKEGVLWSDRMFNGSIDELAMWSKPLSEDDIKNLWRSGDGNPKPTSSLASFKSAVALKHERLRLSLIHI